MPGFDSRRLIVGKETEEAASRSRCSQTAETVIGLLEDAADYRQFEAAVIADYDAQSAVERELVLRLASILWRLRRATTMETGLFEIQAKYIRDYRQGGQVLSDSREVIEKLFEPAVSVGAHEAPHSEAVPGFAMKSDNHAVQLAQCFLRLSNLQNFALDRLSRYEATLWRQAGQILYALEMLDRRKPQERRAHFWFSREKPIE